MKLDIDFLVDDMAKLFNNIIIEEQIQSLGNLKNELYSKQMVVKNFNENLKIVGSGKFSLRLLENLESVENEFGELCDNFDDKLMIFIIGNGNVGKSTLLNSLIGYDVAETNFLPNTWKIDVYSPDLEENQGSIRYRDGREVIFNVNEAKKIIGQEEKKAKDSKREYNIALKQALKKTKIKEERDEVKRYLAEKFLYKSNIIEAKWGVRKNWILDSCLLVDTPGLNQNLHQLEQLGNISDYYHKADGVLWMIDAQTIAAANVKNTFDDLNNTLESVGGVRDNIIGVINRIDLVKETSGMEAVESVVNNAEQNLNDKFYKIVPVSAMQGFSGIVNNDKYLLDESGILNLQNAIRNIFISKAEGIKNSAKLQGNNRLIDNTLKKLEAYSNEIFKYKNLYAEKSEKLKVLRDDLEESCNNDVRQFYRSYLGDVRYRVELYVDMLAKGEGETFIKNKMYKLEEFIKSNNSFIEEKMFELENRIAIWEKVCKISEYKYINTNDILEGQELSIGSDFEFDSLSSIEYFRPSLRNDMFAVFGNLLGKGLFWLRKNKIKATINDTIKAQCNAIENDIKMQIKSKIDKSIIFYKDFLNKGFSDLLFDIEDIEDIENLIEIFKNDLSEVSNEIELKEILF